jgi:hypothetical protein
MFTTENSILEICDIVRNNNNHTIRTDTGEYPFFTNGIHFRDTHRSHVNDHPHESIVLSLATMESNINKSVPILTRNFACDKNTVVLRCDTDYMTREVYNYLMNNLTLLRRLYFGSVVKILSLTHLKQVRVSMLDFNKIRRHRLKTFKNMVETTKLNVDCIIHILGFTYPVIENQNNRKVWRRRVSTAL